jgi:hypothetical protein
LAIALGRRVGGRGNVLTAPSRLALLLPALALAGCDQPPPYVCASDGNCVRGSLRGACVASTEGSYCAFPDGACASRLRWDTSAAADLVGSCVVELGDGGGLPDLARADLALRDLAMPDGAALPDLIGTDLATAVMGPVVALAQTDLNGDGNRDLVLLSPTTLYTLIGLGNGQFGAPSPHTVGTRATGLALGLFDEDSQIDVAVTDAGGNQVAVLLGRPNGTLKAPVNLPSVCSASAPTGIARLAGSSSYDDLAVACDNGSLVILNNASAGAGLVSYVPVAPVNLGMSAAAIVSGDISGHGVADVAVADPMGHTVHLFIQNAPQSLALGPMASPEALAIAALNVDCLPDLAVVGNQNTADVLLGMSLGVYGSALGFSLGAPAANGIAVLDWDGDGIRDLALTVPALNQAVIFAGGGNGTFVMAATHAVSNPTAVVVADWNNDGRPDLAVGDASGSITVWMNAPPRTLSFASSTRVLTHFPIEIGAGDFNNDRKIDLVTIDSDQTVSMLPGDGNGGFAAPQITSVNGPLAGLAVGDWNDDLILDVATAQSTQKNVVVLFGTGNGFGAPVVVPVGNGPRALAAGDWNGDGALDLVVANHDDMTVQVLLGSNSQAFAAQAPFAVRDKPQSLVPLDMNCDGNLDLEVQHSAIEPLWGDGRGGFSSVSNIGAGSPRGVGAADLNGDGVADVFVPSFDSMVNTSDVEVLFGRLSKFPGSVDESYTPHAGPIAIAAADFDGDGNVDLAVVTQVGRTVDVLRGSLDGKLTSALTLNVGVMPSAIAVGDWNGDRKPDLAVANTGDGTLTILLNTSQ